MTGQPHPTAALSRGVDTLAQALATWATRDEAADTAAAIRAGGTALDTIDALLRRLHDARSVLVTEIRQDQDKRAAEADALLATLRHERLGGRP